MTETRIALVFDKRTSYWRAVLHGVLRYAQVGRPWVLHTLQPTDAVLPRWLRRWKPHGMIADLSWPNAAAALARRRGPVVNVSERPVRPARPRVFIDHAAAGRLAADYFLNRGYTCFGFFGYGDRPYIGTLEQAYRAAVEARGRRCDTFDWATVATRARVPDYAVGDFTIGRWLLRLPKPVAVLLHDDDGGMWLTQVCQSVGLRVPEQVAVMGVNNDPLDCQMARPALSSIAMPLEELGYRAAVMLDGLLHGRKPEPMKENLPPAGIVTRASSDLLAIEDADLAAAVRFIREQSHRPLRVSEVLEAVPVSRRMLEHKFRDVLGRSPLQEIRRSHLERARELLRSTPLSLAAVAAKSGFARVEHLSHVFKREEGLTPAAYRRRFLPRGSEPSPFSSAVR